MATVSPTEPPTSAPAWSYTLHLPRDPRSPRVARGTLRSVLVAHDLPAVLDTAELLTSELVTNAYRHSAGSFLLRVAEVGGGRRLRVGVWDTDPYLPAPFDAGPRTPDAEADGGRGLFLVCHYAYAWGGHPVGDGKLLWFELTARPSGGGWAVAA
ncbi:hypothetical protein GCM10018785_27770 [Streptomyces longispororuber]|uniref:Regulatory protein n=1 Tax=Streptomyces longispororuber TaxID=68230 RepID=A0A918ZK29_9ACTN|nr:ATP-binding protein [Streptomyces longispororuber]GHE56968.1 hypothetical protein GCM10018785_27770 [Streptomyces longispororuber]